LVGKGLVSDNKGRNVLVFQFNDILTYSLVSKRLNFSSEVVS
jgi:hypothetical protein